MTSKAKNFEDALEDEVPYYRARGAIFFDPKCDNCGVRLTAREKYRCEACREKCGPKSEPGNWISDGPPR